jgi:hypothetical protein
VRKVVIRIYLFGVVLSIIGCLYIIDQGGGFVRNHNANSILSSLLFYGGTCILWPIAVLVVLMQWLGLIGPLTF